MCKQLAEAAKHYGSKRRIPPGQLQEWAENIPNRSLNQRIRKCHDAIASDVLKQHGVTPIDIVKPMTVAEYWAIQQQKHATLKEAIEQFMQRFEVPDTEKAFVSECST